MGRVKAGRKDNNQPLIVAALQAIGVSVIELPRTGIPGFPDLVIGVSGATHLAEVKNPETRYGQAGLNSNQTAFVSEWRGSPVYVITSELEAIALVNNLRRK